MVENTKNFEFIKNLLNNLPLLKWVKKFSADGLQENEAVIGNFEVETGDNSIVVADTSLAKLFVSNARFSGKAYSSFDLKQIKEALSLLEGDGRLIIGESEDKRVCYIQSEDNVVIVAPTTGEETKKKNPKKKAEKEDSKEEEDGDE